MFYLFLGENSYRALKKIADIKSAFFGKGGASMSVLEVDGAEKSYEQILESIGASDLFSSRRLIILKHVIAAYPALGDFILARGEMLTASKDVFIFWERDFNEKENLHNFFKKNAKKIEEVNIRNFDELDRWLQKEAGALGLQIPSFTRSSMIDEARTSPIESVEWVLEKKLENLYLGGKPSDSSHFSGGEKQIFSFTDQIFNNRFSRAFMALRASKEGGIDEADILRILLWKIKNIFLIQNGESKALNPYVAKKTAGDAVMFDTKKILDVFFAGAMVDSVLKRDKKNAREYLERYLLLLKNTANKIPQ